MALTGYPCIDFDLLQWLPVHCPRVRLFFSTALKVLYSSSSHVGLLMSKALTRFVIFILWSLWYKDESSVWGETFALTSSMNPLWMRLHSVVVDTLLALILCGKFNTRILIVLCYLKFISTHQNGKKTHQTTRSPEVQTLLLITPWGIRMSNLPFHIGST